MTKKTIKLLIRKNFISKSEIVKYEKIKFFVWKIFRYILVLIISFIALIIILRYIQKSIIVIFFQI